MGGQQHKQDENGNVVTIKAGRGTVRYVLTTVLACMGLTGGGYYAVHSKAATSEGELATLRTQHASMVKELDRHVEEQREFLRVMASVDSRLSKIEGKLEGLSKANGK